MDRIDMILNDIDRGLLEAGQITPADDERRRIENDVWSSLDELVDEGYIESQEEAQEMYFEWRTRYLGGSAIKGVKLA